MERLLKKIPFILILFIATICYAQHQSPIEVVELFHSCYGNSCIDEIADYTTDKFRDNKSKSVWVLDT